MFDLSGNIKVVNAQKDILITLSYAKKTHPLISLGSNIKFLSSTLVEEINAKTIAFDIGSNLYLNKYFTLGLSCQNMGGGLKYLEKEDSLPLTFRAGISCCLPNLGLITFDGVKIKNRDLIKHIGLKVPFGNSFSLLTGFKITNKLRSSNLGCSFDSESTSIDYALSIKEVGITNHFGVTYKFP